MEQFAAGIIPYVYYEGKVHFLLGLEKSNNKWSGFVGGAEPGEDPKQTALREFHEETANVFENKQEYIYCKLQMTDPVEVHSRTGKKVYLWFLEFSSKIIYTDLTQFYRNKETLSEAYKEKLHLKWFTFHDIKNDNNTILYQLKHLLFGLISKKK